MLLIVHQCFLMMLSRKMIVRKATLQTTNQFFCSMFSVKIDINILLVLLLGSMIYTILDKTKMTGSIDGAVICIHGVGRGGRCLP